MQERRVYTLETLHELEGAIPLYGVIGFPIAHSRSPAMQEAAFNARGLSARYVRVEVQPDRLAEATRRMPETGFRGWNCTVPHKAEMYSLVSSHDPSALRAQAVNTVLVENGELRGLSTDGGGWVEAIRESFGVSIADLRLLILGAGGSGQTLAREAAFRGCRELYLANRSEDKAVRVLEAVRQSWPNLSCTVIRWQEDTLGAALARVDLVVNTTSIGLRPEDPAVLPSDILPSGVLVYDLVYRPDLTPLVRAALARGLRAADGLSMLLHQGAQAFSAWTGLAAPLEAMRRALSNPQREEPSDEH